MSSEAHIPQQESEVETHAKRRIGMVLRGKYRIDSLLGVGGMAVVYRATHRNQAEFAVKMLHPELSAYEDVKTRFLREGYAANSVKHPGAVMVVDDDVAEDGAAFLVMELLHGEGVEDYWTRSGQRLGVGEALSIGSQLLDVLVAAHDKGIIHRDIKPANLFIMTDGTLKVLDFGIARARDAAAHGHGPAGGHGTGTGMLLGTPAFMPPEQALAKSSEISGQTDVWAVGATLFSLLSGHVVHEGENAPQLLVNAATQPARPLLSVAPHVAPNVAAVIDKALAFEKANRWPTALAMQQAIDQACLETLGKPTSRAILAGALMAHRPTLEIIPSTERAAPGFAFAATHTPAPQSRENAIAVVARGVAHAPAIASSAITPAPTGSGIVGGLTSNPVSRTMSDLVAPPPGTGVMGAVLGFVLFAGVVGSGGIWLLSKSKTPAVAISTSVVAPLASQTAAAPTTTASASPVAPPAASTPPVIAITPAPPAPPDTTAAAPPTTKSTTSHSHTSRAPLTSPAGASPAPVSATSPAPAAIPAPPAPSPPRAAPAPNANPIDMGMK